jgi:hypothetical protein
LTSALSLSPNADTHRDSVPFLSIYADFLVAQLFDTELVTLPEKPHLVEWFHDPNDNDVQDGTGKIPS